MGEEAAAEADEGDAEAEERPGFERRGENDAGEGDDAGERAEARDPMRIGAVREAPRREHEARAAADRQHGRQRGRHADRQVQDLAAVGLEQDVLHAEPGRAERGRDETAARLSGAGEVAPCVEEADGARRRPREPGVARLLLPKRGAVQDHRRHRRALHHLNEPDLGEMAQGEGRTRRR